MLYLYKAMSIIKAREMLKELEIIQIPNLNDGERAKRSDAIYDRAYPKKDKILSMDELAQKLKGLK